MRGGGAGYPEAEQAAMQLPTSKSLSWPELLSALRTCGGASVLIRDGRGTEPAGAVRNRPAAKGTELWLFSGEKPVQRVDLIADLEALAKNSGRRFMTSARANVNKSSLLVESAADEDVD